MMFWDRLSRGSSSGMTCVNVRYGKAFQIADYFTITSPYKDVLFFFWY